MEPWMQFIIFPVVGAIIGAVTNQIAIKMLFRPYKAWKLGGVRLPFTPGVIPQQRGEIARNIAETFESNLLSGQEIHDLITGDKVKLALNRKIDEFIQGLGPLGMMAMGMKDQIIEKILEGIEDVATDAIQTGGDLHVGQKIETKINAMDVEKLEQLVLGFSKKQFRYITVFGGILGALIGVVQATLSITLI